MPLPYSDIVKPDLLSQPVYQPGKPIDDVARELGLDPDGIVKLASNENPLGASPMAKAAAARALQDVHLYPDGGCYALMRELARYRQLEPNQFIVGNGSNEVLELLGHAMVKPGDEVVMAKGAFIVYKLVTLLFGGVPVEVPMRDHRHDLEAMAAAMTDKTKLVFVASPDNPSGTANEEAEILALIDKMPEQAVFVLDEAYAEYLDDPPELRPCLQQGKRIFFTRTFSKIYGLAGLRIGYGYGDPEFVALLNRAREPFNANAIAQAAAIAALQDQEFVLRCKKANSEGLQQLSSAFESLGLEYIPSVANFVTVKVGHGQAAFEAMQRVGVIARPLAPYGMPEWLRVTVGLPDENQRFIDSLTSYLNKA